MTRGSTYPITLMDESRRAFNRERIMRNLTAECLAATLSNGVCSPRPPVKHTSPFASTRRPVLPIFGKYLRRSPHPSSFPVTQGTTFGRRLKVFHE